jgi:hypothetical protein
MSHLTFELAIKILAANAIFEYQKCVENRTARARHFIVFAKDNENHLKIKNELDKLKIPYNIDYDFKMYYRPGPGLTMGMSMSDWVHDHFPEEYITIKYVFSLKYPYISDNMDESIKKILSLHDRTKHTYTSLWGYNRRARLISYDIDIKDILEGGEDLNTSLINKVYFHLNPDKIPKDYSSLIANFTTGIILFLILIVASLFLAIILNT